MSLNALLCWLRSQVSLWLRHKNPFVDHVQAPHSDTSVLAFEVRWADVVGMDFAWRLTEDARLVLEAATLAKRVFSDVSSGSCLVACLRCLLAVVACLDAVRQLGSLFAAVPAGHVVPQMRRCLMFKQTAYCCRWRRCAHTTSRSHVAAAQASACGSLRPLPRQQQQQDQGHQRLSSSGSSKLGSCSCQCQLSQHWQPAAQPAAVARQQQQRLLQVLAAALLCLSLLHAVALCVVHCWV